MSPTLFKNVWATLRERWMQLAAIGVIVVFSSMTYTAMSYALGSIAGPAASYLQDHVQEDFSVEMVSVLTPQEAALPLVRQQVSEHHFALTEIRRSEPATFERLIDGRIDAFKRERPGVSLELRQIKVVSFEHNLRAHTALVARDAERINLSFVEAGRKPERDDEAAINRVYAEKNGIGIGDLFEMKGRRYRVSGYVLFPDYTLSMFDNSFNIDTGLQSLVLLTDGAYDSVDADETFRLVGITGSDAETDTAFDTVIDTAIDTAIDTKALPFVMQIVPTKSNMRSGAIYTELTQGRTMSLGLSIFIAAIAVIIVSIMMSNLLSAERGQIGVLKALGYRRAEVAVPYFVSVVLLASLMLVVGYLVGVWLADPLKGMYLDFFLLPQIEIVQTFEVFATAIFVPLLFFAGSSGAVIRRILGERPLALLRPHESDALNSLTILVSRLLRGARGSTKFKYLHAVRSTGSFVVFFVGIMFSTLLIMYALMMNGMVDRMTVGPLESLGYRYKAVVDPQKRAPDLRPGDERYLVYPYAYLGDKVVSMHGLEPVNALYRLHDSGGRDITDLIRSDAVISESLSRKLGIRPGDTIRVRINDKHHDLLVAGVAHEYSADVVYLNIRTLSSMLSDGETTKLYSGIYAVEEPPAQFYKAVVSKQALIDQTRAMANYTAAAINVMIAASAMIAASILFALTSFAVERNYYSIALLKVLGYSRREVNSMILNSYFFYSLVAYALSVPITLVVLKGLVQVFLLGFGMVIPLEFDPLDAVKGLAILVVVFVVGTWASRRKIARVPLQEVLKTYGE